MPPVFQFTQGTESRSRPNDDSSPLLGRYRAVAPRPSLGRRRSSQLGLLSSRLADAAGSRGSVHVGYGAIVAAQLEDELDSGSDISDNDGGVILWGDEDDNLNGKGWDLFSRKRWERRWRRWVLHLWVEPRQLAVKRVVDVWYSRYGTLVFLPAVLVSPHFTAGKLYEIMANSHVLVRTDGGLVCDSIPTISLPCREPATGTGLG